MALKAVLKTLDGLPEALKALYKQEGEQFVLDMTEEDIAAHPGAGGLSRALAREREAAKAAKKRLEELEEKYKDLDPEAARAAIQKELENKDKKLLDEGKLEELIATRTERMRADFDKQLKAQKDALKAAQDSLAATGNQLAEITIFGAVKDAALGKGARKEALVDITNRAREIWKLEEGKPTARKGQDPIFGKNGEALTITEWVEGLAQEATYLFEPSKGGNGGGGVKFISPGAAGDNIGAIASGEAVIQRQ